jgi:hypothetical protein
MAGARLLTYVALYIMHIIILTDYHIEMCGKPPHAA